MTTLHLFSPAGALAKVGPLRLATKRLTKLGFDVTVDAAATARSQRFAGDDETRLAALHRVAEAAPGVALATRGGYGMTRLLPRIDWTLIARSIERGTQWVGQSDLTALQLGLLAKADGVMWSGPLAADDFGGAEVDDVTEACFMEALHGELEGIGFRTEPGFDGLEARGRLWGGNLCMVTSLLGTPYWPRLAVTRGGVLFLEDVAEHPYRVERLLLQLHQAGVLDSQKAILLGSFTAIRKVPLDRGYGLKTVIAHLRTLTRTPILTGLPFGHIATKVMLPVGRRVTVLVQGRDTFVGW